MKKSMVALASMFACLGAAQAQGISGDVVKIGVLSDMSSLYADTAGKGSVESARMAIADFGGTVLGKKVELVFADHQNKADVASTKAREWFDKEGVDMIMNMNNSAVAIAVNGLARERNKTIMNTGAVSTALTNEHCGPTLVHYTYDTYAMTNAAVKGVLAQGKKDWFIISVDYAAGKAMASTATEFVDAGGGKIVGQVAHPLNASDFSSYVTQAAASKAQVVTLANATNDTVNTIKAAYDFGLTKNQILVPQLMFINDIHGLGLKYGQGMTFATAFYWDRTPESRAWAQRYFERMKKMPSMVQAGDYSAVMTYLQAVKDAGSDDGLAVAAQMKKMKINDVFSQNGYVREDGRMVHDMYVVQVKKPEESKAPWDYYKVLSTIPGDEAFRPLSKSTCSLVKKS